MLLGGIGVPWSVFADIRLVCPSTSICLLLGTVNSGRCPDNQRSVVRVDMLEEQPRSENLIRESPLDNGNLAVLGFSPYQPSAVPGWPVGLKTQPESPIVKRDRGLNFQTVAVILPLYATA